MSESVVFELKLQIQHLQEKLTFLAGGSNGAELVEVLMEKDEELERNTHKLKEVETKMFQLGEGAKRVDTKRRELARQCEHQAVRMEALEKELERQLSMSDELRRKVADTREELGATQGDLRKTQDEMANSQVVAQQALAAARAEASELQGIVECQRERIAGLEVTMKSLGETVEAKDKEIKSVEERRKDVAARGREIKTNLEAILKATHLELDSMMGVRNTLEKDNSNLRKRIEEKVQQCVQQETKHTALTRECGSLRTELDGAKQELVSSAKELAAVRANKEKADEMLLAKDKENSKLKAKVEELIQEIARLKHRTNQEQAELKQRMEEHLRVHRELEATLQDQMRRQENDNNLMVETLAEEKSGLERQLKAVEDDRSRLTEERCSLRKEAAIRAKKAEATSKSEARWRARAEETVAARNAEIQELKGELDRLRHQGVGLNKLQAENTELKDRIERQEAYQKRKMAKEKKERARASSRSSSVGPSGRASIQLLPLPPAMSDQESTDGHCTYEPTQNSQRASARTSSSSSRRESTSSSVGVGVRAIDRRPRSPKSVGVAAGSRGGGSNSTITNDMPTLSPYQPPRTPVPSPSPINKASDIRKTTTDDHKSPEVVSSSTPSAADTPAIAPPSTATDAITAPIQTTTLIPAQEPSAETGAPIDADKENGSRPVVLQRASPAAVTPSAAPVPQSCASGAGGGGWVSENKVGEGALSRKCLDRVSAGEGVDMGDGGGGCDERLTKSGGRRGRGLSMVVKGNGRMSLSGGENNGCNGLSVGKSGGDGGIARTRGRAMETRAIRSVTKSTALGTNNEGASTRYPSRGRRPVPAPLSTPRSSSEGLQSRAALGWR